MNLLNWIKFSLGAYYQIYKTCISYKSIHTWQFRFCYDFQLLKNFFDMVNIFWNKNIKCQFWYTSGATSQILIITHMWYVPPTVDNIVLLKKVKWSRYRPGVAQRVGRGIALLFHDHGTRRGWVVSSTPRPHFTPGKDPVLILQEAGWAPGPVWTGGKSRPHRDSIPGHPAHSQSQYRLNYRAHI